MQDTNLHTVPGAFVQFLEPQLLTKEELFFKPWAVMISTSCVTLSSKAKLKIPTHPLWASLSPGTFSRRNDKSMKLQFVKYFNWKGNSAGSIEAVKLYDCYDGKSSPRRAFTSIVTKHRMCAAPCRALKALQIFATRGRTHCLDSCCLRRD